MFRKKKTTPTYNQVGESTQISYDFRLRGSAAFESYRPLNYTIDRVFDEETMKTEIDGYLGKMLDGADEFNGGMLDHFLIGVTREAFGELLLQRVGHADVIHRLSIREKSDKDDITARVAEVEKQLEDAENSYARLQRLADRYYPDARPASHPDARPAAQVDEDA